MSVLTGHYTHERWLAVYYVCSAFLEAALPHAARRVKQESPKATAKAARAKPWLLQKGRLGCSLLHKGGRLALYILPPCLCSSGQAWLAS
jgi:hypothetical protein